MQARLATSVRDYAGQIGSLGPSDLTRKKKTTTQAEARAMFPRPFGPTPITDHRSLITDYRSLPPPITSHSYAVGDAKAGIDSVACRRIGGTCGGNSPDFRIRTPMKLL
jgi:hypothetical protein